MIRIKGKKVFLQAKRDGERKNDILYREMDSNNNSSNNISQDGFPTLNIEENTESGNQDQSSVVLNYESLIKEGISKVNKLKAELREYNETIEGTLANDVTYKSHSESAKEAAKVRNATKQEILKRPEVANIALKAKSVKEEIKDLNMRMSDYLQEYAKLAGTNQIEGEDGQLRTIVYTAKLVKK